MTRTLRHGLNRLRAAREGEFAVLPVSPRRVGESVLEGLSSAVVDLLL